MRARFRQSGLRLLGLFLAGAMVACETTGQATELRDDRGNIPLFEAVRRRQPSQAEHVPASPAALSARLLRLELPLGIPLDEVWEVIDEEVASSVLLDAWHLNGLRIGVLREADLQTFIERMPPLTNTAHGMLATERQELTALYHAPPLHGQVSIDLTIPPFAPRHEVIRGGRVQLLARIIRDQPMSAAEQARGSNGRSADEERAPTTAEAKQDTTDADTEGQTSPVYRMVVELVPHHHRVRSTLLPRMPQEKLLDGRVFEEIALRLNVTTNDRIVIGLYHEPAEPPLPEAHLEENADESRPNETTREVEPPAPAGMDPNRESDAPQEQEEPHPDAESAPDMEAPPAEPAELRDHFGRRLLTGRRLNRDVQVLLVITIHDPLSEAGQSGQSPLE